MSPDKPGSRTALGQVKPKAGWAPLNPAHRHRGPCSSRDLSDRPHYPEGAASAKREVESHLLFPQKASQKRANKTQPRHHQASRLFFPLIPRVATYRSDAKLQSNKQDPDLLLEPHGFNLQPSLTQALHFQLQRHSSGPKHAPFLNKCLK